MKKLERGGEGGVLSIKWVESAAVEGDWREGKGRRIGMVEMEMEMRGLRRGKNMGCM